MNRWLWLPALCAASVSAMASDLGMLIAQGELQDKATQLEVRRTGKAEPVLVLQGKEGRCSFRLQTWRARAALTSHVPIASLEGKRQDCSPQWQVRLGKGDRVRGLLKPTGGAKPGMLIFESEADADRPARERVSLPIGWVRLLP